MRVTFLSGTYAPDRCGVSRYTQKLKQLLQRQGHDITHLTTFEAAQSYREPGVQGVVADWRNRDLLPLAQAILSQPTDLHHLQHSAANYHWRRAIGLLPLLLRGLGSQIPVITTVHEYGDREWFPWGVPLSTVRKLHRWGEQEHIWDRENFFLLAKSQVIITTSDQTTRLLLSRLPRFEHRLRQFQLAPTLEVSPASRATVRRRLQLTYHWPADAIVVTYLGFIHPIKGLKTLLAAFAAAAARKPQLRLLIIGGSDSVALSGPRAQAYEQSLQELVTTQHLTGKVQFTGHIDDALASGYLCASDLGVLPSDFGISQKSSSLIALLQHQLPVIITRHRPLEIQLEKQPFTSVFEPGDASALEHALLRLSRSAFLRRKLGRMAKEYSQQFSWDRLLRQHYQLYQEVGRQLPSRFEEVERAWNS